MAIDITTEQPLDHEVVPLDHFVGGAAQARLMWLTDRLHPGDTVCDLGCIDGLMTNRWGRAGFKVTGVDVCVQSVRIAQRSAEANNTGARHIAATFPDAVGILGEGQFDSVTTGDVYEHMLDPISMLLGPARKLVKETGQLLLTTPHGAWFRGKFAMEAHPWLWGPSGRTWLCDEPRAHLIAPSVWSVAKDLREAGWWPHTVVVVPSWQPQVSGQGNVCARALPNPPAGWPGLDIVFYLGDGVEFWTPGTVDMTGIGGSESAAIHMAKRLVQLGNRVRVFSSCGNHGEGIYEGVEYLQTEKYHNLTCDVLVVSRIAPALHEQFAVDAKVRMLWTHDIYPKALDRELALRIDCVLVLSDWHRANVLRSCPYLHPDQMYKTRNGIELKNFERTPQRNPHKAVYSSSPDRGLPALLQVWPRIRAQVPDAELHVFYGFKNWAFGADDNQKRLIESLHTQMRDMESLGVRFHDRLPQHVLAEEFLSAGVWLYPTWFTETSCITAMEATAAGLRIVTSAIAALNETVGDNGVLLSGDWLSPQYQDEFVQRAVQAMTAPEDGTRERLAQYAREHFGWDPVAEDWHRLMQELVKQSDAGTLVLPYQST